MAILLALATPGIEVAAITTVAGNVGVARVTRNVLAVLDAAGACVPVYRGAATPLDGRRLAPRGVHGRDGLGNTSLPPPCRVAEDEPADAALTRLLAAPGAAYTVVALGPLTNLARALAEPAARRGLGHLVVAAGATLEEFNLQADPPAAARVLGSGVTVTLVGRELSYGAARLSSAEIGLPEGANQAAARLAARLLHFLVQSGRARFRWQDGAAAAPDTLALAIALDPALIARFEPAIATVETAGPDAGRLTVRERGVAASALALVEAIEAERYKRTLIAALGGRSPA